MEELLKKLLEADIQAWTLFDDDRRLRYVIDANKATTTRDGYNYVGVAACAIETVSGGWVFEIQGHMVRRVFKGDPVSNEWSSMETWDETDLRIYPSWEPFTRRLRFVRSEKKAQRIFG